MIALYIHYMYSSLLYVGKKTDELHVKTTRSDSCLRTMDLSDCPGNRRQHQANPFLSNPEHSDIINVFSLKGTKSDNEPGHFTKVVMKKCTNHLSKSHAFVIHNWFKRFSVFTICCVKRYQQESSSLMNLKPFIPFSHILGCSYYANVISKNTLIT